MAITLKNNKTVRSLVNKDKLTPHLDKALAEGEFEWEYKFDGKAKDDAWHPSGDCTPSLLDLYEKATRDPNEPTEKHSVGLVKTFQVGHFWHQYLQWVVAEKLQFAGWSQIEVVGHKWWGDPIPPADVEDWPLNDHGGDMHKRMYRKENLYYLRYPEQQDGRVTPDMFKSWPSDETGMCKVRPQPFHWVRGSADICPVNIPVHGEYLVDFKTMNAHDFRQSGPPERYADKWECQLNIYMSLFDMERAIIVGVQKDSPHDLKEFHYERNQPLIDAIYTKWHIVSDCLDEGVPPTDEPEVKLPLRGINE